MTTVHLDPEAWERKCRIVRIVLFSALAACVTAVALFLLIRNVIVPAARYAQAEKALAGGDTVGAVERFVSAGDFRDARSRAAQLAFGLQEDPSIEEAFRSANVGDVIVFGSYEQDNRTGTGAEPIEWIVLSKENGILTLMSVYVLDCVPYNDIQTDVTWEKSTLRVWMNDTFYNTAFTDSEKALILTSRIKNGSNPASSVPGGRNTVDKVYALSFDDLISIAQKDRAFDVYGIYASPTPYAVFRGTAKHSDYHTACWWFRTPGKGRDQAMYVDMSGSPLHSSRVAASDYGARPVIRVFAGG